MRYNIVTYSFMFCLTTWMATHVTKQHSFIHSFIQFSLNDIVLTRTDCNVAPFYAATAADKKNKFHSTAFRTVKSYGPA